MSQTIQISGQKPAELYPQHVGLPVISPSLPPEEYFEEVKKAVDANISTPLFTPFSSTPVDIQIDGKTIDQESVTQSMLSIFTEPMIQGQLEESLRNILVQSMRYLQDNNWNVKGQCTAETFGHHRIPLPQKMPYIGYTPQGHIIPQAKALLANTSDAFEKELWSAYMGAYLDQSVDALFITVQSDATWNKFLEHANAIFNAHQAAGNLDPDCINMAGSLQKMSMKSELQLSLILSQKDDILETTAPQNQAYSFLRIFLNCLASFTGANPDEMFVQPIDLAEYYFPTNIVIMNLDEYAHATPEELRKEWATTKKGFAIAKQLKILSLKALRTAPAVGRTNIQKGQYAITSYNAVSRAANRKFSEKPVSSKRLVSMMFKVMKSRITSKMTSNTYVTEKLTYMRPNRRRPDDPNAMGKMKNTKYRPDIHVYLDCSGSISEDMYSDTVLNLIRLAQKSQVDFYFTTFSHYITEAHKVEVKGRPATEVYKEIQGLPKASGGTDFTLVWNKIKYLDKWNRMNNKSYQINFMITDFCCGVGRNTRFRKGAPEVDNLYYVPISTSARNWKDLVRWAEDFSRNMMLAGDIDIKRRMLL